MTKKTLYAVHYWNLYESFKQEAKTIKRARKILARLKREGWLVCLWKEYQTKSTFSQILIHGEP